MTSEELRLQQEIDELLAQAQAADASEDEEHGSDCRGDELPDELARRETRLQKIREAKRRWKNGLVRRPPTTPPSWSQKAARRDVPTTQFPSRRINGTSPIPSRRS